MQHGPISQIDALPGHLADNAQALREAGLCSTYSDRVCSPATTAARLRPHFPKLGITRVGRVTGLDRIGIPVFIAVRPNGRSLSVTQGKGLDDAAARASAIMEAAEQAIAETPTFSTRLACVDELRYEQASFVRPERFLKPGASLPVSALIEWTEGWDLIAEQPTWVPVDAVRLDLAENGLRPPHPFYQTSDGLASGNLLLEAILHGLYERIERDSATLWSYRDFIALAERAIDPADFDDAALLDLAAHIAAAGVGLRLFDITSDLGIPTFLALLKDSVEAGPKRRVDLCSGSGCHWLAARAAIRAVTEAAQSRITAIVGARDDFGPDLYTSDFDPRLARLMDITQNKGPKQFPPSVSPLDTGAQLLALVDRLRSNGIRQAVAVPLGGEEFGIAVVKMVVSDLEDPPDAPHRKLGRRALNAMLGQVL